MEYQMNGPTETSSSPSESQQISTRKPSREMLSPEQDIVENSSPVDVTAPITHSKSCSAPVPAAVDIGSKQRGGRPSTPRKTSNSIERPCHNKHLRERKVVLLYITRILKKKGSSSSSSSSTNNDENDLSIKKAAARLEDILHRNSNSMEEYLDKSTLKSRIRNVLQSIK